MYAHMRVCPYVCVSENRACVFVHFILSDGVDLQKSAQYVLVEHLKRLTSNRFLIKKSMLKCQLASSSTAIFNFDPSWEIRPPGVRLATRGEVIPPGEEPLFAHLIF
jgi:hypothetical protein